MIPHMFNSKLKKFNMLGYRRIFPADTFTSVMSCSMSAWRSKAVEPM